MKQYCLAIVASLILLSGVAFGQGGGQLTIAIRNADYDTLDPHVSAFTQSAYIFQNIFDRLIYLNSEGEYEPWLATSWTSNADATSWVLVLRDDVTFQDGTAFDAAAVKFNLNRMTNPTTQSKQAGPLMGPYSGSEVIDAHTLKVDFSEPNVLFPFSLSNPFMGMVSPTAVEAYGDRFTDHLVGSGPFKFVSEIRGNEIVLARNDEYSWAPASFHTGPAYLERVVFRFVTEDVTRMATLETGESQIVDEIPPTQVQRMQADPRFEVLGASKVGIARSLFFNTVLAPTNDLRVRQAISYAIDRSALDQAVFRGVYPMATQILTPGVRYYDTSLDNTYPFDPDKARSLLEEAGWTVVNQDGYRVKDGRVLSLYHATFEGFVAEAPAEIIQAQLKDVGVRFDVNVMSGTAMMDGIAAKDSSINTALVGTYSPDPGLILSRFFSSSGLGTVNYTHFATPELDALLNEGLSTTDDSRRAAIYHQISQILMDNAVAVPLYANVSIFATVSSIEGFKFDPFAHPQLFDIRYK